MSQETSAIKIPAYNALDPALWFYMVECTFQLATPKPITDSRTKFNYVAAHLPPEIAIAVRDVIMKPDETTPYETVKKTVISRCGESKSQEIRRLLAGEQLGDRKPSELLRIMQRRAESHNIENSLLLELFLQQMPRSIQTVLASITSINSEMAAEVADRVLEIAPPEVHQTAVAPVTSAGIPDRESLLAEIQQLRSEVQQLRRSRSRSTSRHHHQFRRRSPSSGSSHCWYHRRFKAQANKCVPPCTFLGNSNMQE